MTVYATIYNEAIILIQKGSYLKAEKILKELASQVPNNSLTYYTLGLVEATIGKPYEALRSWDRVSAEENPSIRVEREQLIEALPAYEAIFTKNNAALKEGQAENFSQSIALYKEIMNEGKDIPLPVTIYEGYLLCLLLSEQLTEFEKVYGSAPNYVKEAPQVRELYFMMDTAGLNSQLIQSKARYKRNKRFLIGFISAAAIAVIAALGISLNKDSSEPTPSAAASEAVNEKLTADLEKELEDLKEENNTLRSNADKLAAEEVSNAELSQLVKATDVDIASLEAEASEGLYQKGYAAYESGDYEGSVESLTRSIDYNNKAYYSDDAHFFLIQSLYVTDQLEEAVTQMHAFLEANYAESPYVDDVMLQLAKSSLQMGDREQASALLLSILELYPDEWTASEAQKILAE